MQLFRRAWCQDPGDDKPEKAPLQKPTMRPSSITSMSPLAHMKRKRDDGSECPMSPEKANHKRRKLHPLAQRRGPTYPRGPPKADSVLGSYHGPAPYPQPSIPNTGKTSPSAPTQRDTSDATLHGEAAINNESHVDATSGDAELKEKIEHQFNLEILLKHRELRLIEQELAKCQVALEQLRRCELVPFPGSTGLSTDMSAGTGPSLRAQPGHTQPHAPPPWGVADGPYTRHYARWLLNDTTFDSVPAQHAPVPVDYFSNIPEGRATRNSGAAAPRASKGRPPRDSVGNLSHALPNYPTQGRGKSDPLVIKRMADNKFVKLICNNCNRSNFSSVQGFLNHCRIAHKVDYKSHEAAATDCGHALEDDEMYLVPQSMPVAAPVVKPPRSRAASTAFASLFTPAPAQVAQAPSVAFVHPLNNPVIPPRFTWKAQAAAARAAAAELAIKAGPMPSSQGRQEIDTAMTGSATSDRSAPLIPSSSTPYISSYFAKRGLGGNIHEAALRAQENIDLGLDADDEETPTSSRKPSVSRSTSISKNHSGQTSGKAGFNRPQGRKDQHVPQSRPRPAPLAHPSRSTSQRGVTETMESPQESTLSPHAADSNPGLVTDHEDDDDVVSDLDEARSEHHESSEENLARINALRAMGGHCGEAMDVDMEEAEDVEGHHEILIRPRGQAFQEFGPRTSEGGSRLNKAAK